MNLLDIRPEELKEWHLQAYVSLRLHRLGILHHGDQNSGKRGKLASGISKATGMCSGWPDMCIIYDGKVCWIELKRVGGKLSPQQRNLHGLFAEQGFKVHVVYGLSCMDAWEQVCDIIGCMRDEDVGRV